MSFELKALLVNEAQPLHRLSAPPGVSKTAVLDDRQGESVEQPKAGAADPRVAAGELNQAVSNINDYVQTVQRTLKFSVDEDTGRTVITVVDRQTDEVIRQIPPEVTMEIASRLQSSVGLLLKTRV
jgi:flagellar protein FlaG